MHRFAPILFLLIILSSLSFLRAENSPSTGISIGLSRKGINLNSQSHKPDVSPALTACSLFTSGDIINGITFCEKYRATAFSDTGFQNLYRQLVFGTFFGRSPVRKDTDAFIKIVRESVDTMVPQNCVWQIQTNTDEPARLPAYRIESIFAYQKKSELSFNQLMSKRTVSDFMQFKYGALMAPSSAIQAFSDQNRASLVRIAFGVELNDTNAQLGFYLAKKIAYAYDSLWYTADLKQYNAVSVRCVRRSDGSVPTTYTAYVVFDRPMTDFASSHCDAQIRKTLYGKIARLVISMQSDIHLKNEAEQKLQSVLRLL